MLIGELDGITGKHFHLEVARAYEIIVEFDRAAVYEGELAEIGPAAVNVAENLAVGVEGDVNILIGTYFFPPVDDDVPRPRLEVKQNE
jgi:hypothetical protein